MVLSERLYFYTVWIMRMVYLNVLWITFTIMGLVVFGLFPATAGLFTIIRKWLMKSTDIPIFQTFWKAYKYEFKRANVAELIFFFVGLIAYADLNFVQLHHGIIYDLLFHIIILIIVSYIVTLLFFFPVLVYYDLKLIQHLKQAFLVGVTNPLACFMMIAGLILVWFAIKIIPGILPFFSVNLVALIFMWSGLRAFNRIEEKRSTQNGH